MKKSKSIYQKRKDVGAICKNCFSPNYRIENNKRYTKPQIICNQCGNFWMYGKNGGIYVELSNDINARTV